jgi:acetyl-CoA acetyltransferase
MKRTHKIAMVLIGSMSLALQRGMAAQCIGGGEATAMAIERIQ